MAKNRKQSIEETKRVIYDTVNEIEIENGVQILQNDEKLNDLAARILDITRTSTYSEFLSELYYRVAQLKFAISNEIAAIKNKNTPKSNYVLAINA